jgi:hypothetical protein
MSDKNEKNTISFNWWGISSFCCCSLLMLVLFLIIRTIADKQKFNVASEALKQGNTRVALAALSPEVSGVGKYIGF